MASQHDIPVAKLALLGFLGTTLVIVIILAMTVLYYRTTGRLENERVVRQPYVDTETALADQQARLLQYEKTGVVEENGVTRTVYRIPIERAMERVLADWQSGVLPGKKAEAGDRRPETE